MWAVTVKYVLLLGTQAKEHSTAAGCCPGWQSYPPCCAVDHVHFHGLWRCSTINKCQPPRNAWKISSFTSENSILQTCKMLHKLTQFFYFNFTKFAVHTLIHTLSPPHLSWCTHTHTQPPTSSVLVAFAPARSLFHGLCSSCGTSLPVYSVILLPVVIHIVSFFLSLTKNTIYIDKYTV